MTLKATLYARQTFGQDPAILVTNGNHPIATFDVPPDDPMGSNVPESISWDGKVWVKEQISFFGQPVIRYYALSPITVAATPV